MGSKQSVKPAEVVTEPAAIVIEPPSYHIFAFYKGEHVNASRATAAKFCVAIGRIALEGGICQVTFECHPQSDEKNPDEIGYSSVSYGTQGITSFETAMNQLQSQIDIYNFKSYLTLDSTNQKMVSSKPISGFSKITKDTNQITKEDFDKVGSLQALKSAIADIPNPN